MRFTTLTLIIAIIGSVLLTGCMSSGPPVRWSENLAIQANSRDTKFHDDNMYTEGETGPIIEDEKDVASQMESDKNSEAVLQWVKPQMIQRVVVKADIGELEFFDIQYMDDQEKWQTVGKVKNHIKDKYQLKLKRPVVTRKLRLLVPRAWDSRRVSGGKRATRSEGGAPVLSYKKIREIEVYYALPAEEPVTSE